MRGAWTLVVFVFAVMSLIGLARANSLYGQVMFAFFAVAFTACFTLLGTDDKR